MWTERDKIYVDEYGLSHPKTNQQPLGNKNVLSVIVNYKYWSSPCCSLLIMLNGLPLTIMKPLTLCVCAHVYVCARQRQRERKEGSERLYGCLFEKISGFYGLEGSSALQHQLCVLSNITFTCLLCVCFYVWDISDQNEDSKQTEKRVNGKN